MAYLLANSSFAVIILVSPLSI